MNIINRNQWEDTYEVLHHLCQMIGKTKLATTPLQPEWANVPLEVYPLGLRTGLLYKDGINFEIILDFYTFEVSIYSNSDKKSFKIEGNVSVSKIYAKFTDLLSSIGLNINLYSVPQEMATKTRFENNNKTILFDKNSATNAFQLILYAYHELNIFIAPFRSKKVTPKFYWGTFDLGTTLFSGKPAPYETDDIITRVGFDEQMIEYGYAFDNTIDGNPYFYILIYPIKNHAYHDIPLNGEGYFSKEKSEFFLPLKPIFGKTNSSEIIQNFFKESFSTICEIEKWANLEWYTLEIK